MGASKSLLIHQQELQSGADVAKCERDMMFDSFQLLQERVEGVMSRLGREHPEYDTLMQALMQAAYDTGDYLKSLESEAENEAVGEADGVEHEAG